MHITAEKLLITLTYCEATIIYATPISKSIHVLLCICKETGIVACSSGTGDSQCLDKVVENVKLLEALLKMCMVDLKVCRTEKILLALEPGPVWTQRLNN